MKKEIRVIKEGMADIAESNAAIKEMLMSITKKEEE